jgi:hypothetical protein
MLLTNVVKEALINKLSSKWRTPTHDWTIHFRKEIPVITTINMRIFINKINESDMLVHKVTDKI